MGTNMSDENYFREYFVTTLNDEYQVNVVTDYGIIDVLTEKVIYELKVKDTFDAIHHAVGQLLFYSEAFPERERCVVTPFKLSDKTLRVLDNNDISSITIKWDFKPRKRKELILKKERIKEDIEIRIIELKERGIENPTYMACEQIAHKWNYSYQTTYNIYKANLKW